MFGQTDVVDSDLRTISRPPDSSDTMRTDLPIGVGTTIAQSRWQMLPYLLMGLILVPPIPLLAYSWTIPGMYNGWSFLKSVGLITFCLTITALCTVQFIWPSRLTITSDGFLYITPGKTLSWTWDQVSNFQIFRYRGPGLITFDAYGKGGLAHRTVSIGSHWAGGLTRTVAWLERARRQHSADGTGTTMN